LYFQTYIYKFLNGAKDQILGEYYLVLFITTII